MSDHAFVSSADKRDPYCWAKIGKGVCGLPRENARHRVPFVLERTLDLTQLAAYADEAIGSTANREGDAYAQGVRDLARHLAGLEPMPDRLKIGTLHTFLE